MQSIGVEDFMKRSASCPVLDVRSPSEYNHAHIPGAISLPLFSDEERKIVGTLYKQQGREPAIKAGLDIFGPKMRLMVEAAERIPAKTKSGVQMADSHSEGTRSVLLHCWRGGMRSAGVGWLLDLYGFRVYTLRGGYKAYRGWVLQQFDQPYPFRVLGGYTGSGKTDLLKELSRQGHSVIDLEGLARHKGSAFGALGETEAPGQEQFENLLAEALAGVSGNCDTRKPVWIEDESRRIGNVNLPAGLWHTLRLSPLYFLNIPFEERLGYLVAEYGRFKEEQLINPILRITKRLGSLNAKNAINYLLEDNVTECFRILLHYYDKFYGKDVELRKSQDDQIITVPCERVDAAHNLNKLMPDL